MLTKIIFIDFFFNNLFQRCHFLISLRDNCSPMVRNKNFKYSAVFTSKQGLQLLLNRKALLMFLYLFLFGRGYLILDTGQWDYLGFLLCDQFQATDEVWPWESGFRVNWHSCLICKVAENPSAFLYSWLEVEVEEEEAVVVSAGHWILQ